jgi:nucleoid-associated protein YgaU
VASDWGLKQQKPAKVTKLRVALAVGCLLAAGGGYGAYTQFFANRPASETPTGESDDVAETDLPENSEPPVEGAIDDPFGETLMSSSSGGSRSSTEPRKVAEVVDAAPISGRNSRNSASRTGAGKRSQAADEEIPDLDDTDSPGRGQTEPEFADDSSSSGLGGSSTGSRRLGSTGTGARSGQSSGMSRHNSPGGPRISPSAERDADFSSEFPEERLDGYNVASQRQGKREQPTSSSGPRISVVNGRDDFEQDERLEGFVTEQPTTRRAVSRTRVVRSEDDLTETSRALSAGNAGSGRTAAGQRQFDDDDFSAPSAPLVGDSERSPGSHFRSRMTPIQRRATPPAAMADSTFKSPRRAFDDDTDTPTAPSATYRVAADDNFWKISRKQYGTARYFQALTRHNQDRVPDPEKLRPGMQISTPSAAYLEKNYPDLIEKSPPGAEASRSGAARPNFERPLSDSGFDGPASRATTGDGAATGYFYSKGGDPLYRIGPDDTLTSIAQRHLGRASRWTEIYEQNRDILKSPDDLKLGTVIRLPGDSSRLSLVPEGDRRR